MNVIAIIQARMGSTRLPGKVLADLHGWPMLARVVQRAARTQNVAEVVVATSTRADDDAIERLCRRMATPCFRGSEHDVLDRYYQAARAFRADAVVRITSDCPLIDPGLIDRVVGEFLARQPAIHYACNSMPYKTFPRGLDTETVRFDALERAWREDRDPARREHVTPYVYRHPHRFRLHAVLGRADYSHLRWTVDTPEDLRFVRCIYQYFGDGLFSWEDVLAALEMHPDWQTINQDVQQKAA